MSSSKLNTDNIHLRVLHCIHSLSGGGAERQLSLLVGQSKNAGMSPTVFCLNDNKPYEGFSNAKIIKSRQKNSKDLLIFKNVSEAIQEVRPHLLHAWLPASVTIPTMVMSWFAGCPVVFAYRNEMCFRRSINFVEYLCALFTSSGVISNTPIYRSGQLFQALSRWKRGVVVPNAVFVPENYKLDVTCGASVHPQQDPLKLLYVGRLTRQKNWRCLIEALPKIKEEVNWRLTICGDGEDLPVLQATLTDLNLAHRVDILGYRTDVFEVMRGANLLILPSYYEGMPNVLLEAMAIGLPCVVSDIPAVRDLLGDSDCVLKFHPSRPHELASLIDLASDDQPLLSSKCQKGLKLAEQFSVERMVNAYRDYYLSIVKLDTTFKTTLGTGLSSMVRRVFRR